MKKCNIVIHDSDEVNGGAAKVAFEHFNALNKVEDSYYFSAGYQSFGDKHIVTNQLSLRESSIFNKVLYGLLNLKALYLLVRLISKLDCDRVVLYIHGYLQGLSSSVFLSKLYRGKKIEIVQIVHDYAMVCPTGNYFDHSLSSVCKHKPISVSCVLSNCGKDKLSIKLYRCFRLVFDKLLRKLILIDRRYYLSKYSMLFNEKYNNDAKLISVVPNSTPIKNKDRIWCEKNNNIVFIGRLVEEKGLEDLITLYECIKEKAPNIKLVVIGEGGYYESLKNMGINCIGWKSSSEISKELSKSRALFFPSICLEVDPLTPHEAMAFGVPVITNKQNVFGMTSDLTKIIYNKYKMDDLIVRINDDHFIKRMSIETYDGYQENIQEIIV